MKMAIFQALLLGSCVACNSSPPAASCQRFRSGDFTYRLRGPSPQESLSFTVTRRGAIQTETNQQNGAVSRLAVRWLDSCTYELRLLESTEQFPKEIEELRRTSPLRTEIIGATPTYYLFRSQRAGYDLVLTDTIWLAK